MRNQTIPTVGLLLASCSSPALPPVENWGSVFAALAQGRTEARVNLADIARPGMWGVGALEELAGEVTIADGEVWTSSVADDHATTNCSRAPTAKATILFASEVRRWREVRIERDVPAAGLEAFITDQAHDAGLPTGQPFAFRIEGPLHELALHVIAGECPMRARMMGVEPKQPPYRASLPRTRGRLIGVYARDGGGVSSHHGQKTHVHVLLDGTERLTGHVESVAVGAGATLYLPIE